MKAFKIIAITVVIIVIVLIASLIVLPVLFKDQIAERVKVEINKNIEARVDWGDFGLTFFRNFPNLTFSLNNLTVTGIEAFEGDTLTSVGSFRLVLDLGSVVRGVRKGDQIVIRSIEINNPFVYAKVLKDGQANWDIIMAEEEEVVPDEELEVPAFNVGLQRFEIRNARIVFEDLSSGLYASIDGLNHSLRGDFTQDLFTLYTQTHADELTVRFAGIPYLNRVMLDVKADLEADMVQKRFTFKENEIRMNELMLGFDGFTAMLGDSVEVDMTLSAARAQFKDILSFVPAIYMQDFQQLQTSGNVAINGHMKGTYAENNLPSFALNVDVANGMFRYPDLPLPAQNIFVDLSIDNPGGDIDNTVVNMKRFHIELGSEPFEAHMTLRTPVSDPDIDFGVTGKIDLAEINRTMKLEGIEELTGIITADAAMRTRMSYIENEQYERITARGSVDIRDMTVRNEELKHAVEISEVLLVFSPQHAEMKSFIGQIGSSDMQMTGYLDNLLGFVLRDDELRGRATFTSSFFNLDEWQDDEELEIIPVPANIDFTMNATIARMVFDNMEMTNARGNLHLKDQRITLQNFAMNTLGGEIVMSGYYETTDVTKPTFDFDLAMENINIPNAFATFNTVQMLAPVAEYAMGSFSANLKMNGALGKDMMPLFDVLNGRGTLQTSSLAIQGFPAMDKLADALKMQQLRNPSLEDIRSSIDIKDGRLFVSPFDVRLGKSKMNVSGSNGIDRSLDYALALEVPRSELGTEANRVIGDLISQVGRTGINLQAADAVKVNVLLGGTITNPSLKLDFGGVVTSARDQVESAVREEVERRVEEVEERIDEAKEEARRKAQEEADRLIRDAEQRATMVRDEARKLAETVRKEGYEQADKLLEQATNPITRAAARPAADRLRKEADDKASQIIREADQQAENIVAEARRKANELLEES
jgi:vacuolar-type H+-ATPase subunit H